MENSVFFIKCPIRNKLKWFWILSNEIIISQDFDLKIFWNDFIQFRFQNN